MAFLDLVAHPEDVGNLNEGIQQAFTRGQPFEMETRMRRQDGEYRWFLYQLRPLRDEQGRVSRWCGTRTDIDDQKRAVAQARQEKSPFANISTNYSRSWTSFLCICSPSTLMAATLIRTGLAANISQFRHGKSGRLSSLKPACGAETGSIAGFLNISFLFVTRKGIFFAGVACVPIFTSKN